MSHHASTAKPGAIVIGAASGLGLVLTKRLLSKGWVVVMADIDPAGEGIAKEMGENVLWVKNDTWGLERNCLKVLDVNLQGAIYEVKIFLHHIQKLNPGPSGGGGAKARVAITGSQGGFYPLPDPVYSARKHDNLLDWYALLIRGTWRCLALLSYGLIISLLFSLRVASLFPNVSQNSINPGYMKIALVAPLISITPDEYETPMLTLMKAHDDLLEGGMTSATIRASGKDLYY
ncbi:hypothetical protein BDZ45DRAFT_759728 [Acephala macrosclerotiorum]|nr:hypothetical protein BDZ45DRAFT_759728 [Acephala macrosclerotiorum]